jgi:hypothetical protein
LKRIAAILFLCVLLFNLYGYQWVIDCIQDRKEQVLLTQLDKEAYQNEDLVSIKTPINLPYYTNSAAYERIDGTIEIDGIAYNYVKRRIFNDSLELLCLPNTARQQLQTAKADFFKLTNGYPASEGAKKVASIIKNALPEYCEDFTSFNLNTHFLIAKSYPGFYACFLPYAGSSKQDQPPESSMPLFT